MQMLYIWILAAGTTVVVDRIEGVKLMVRPAKAPVGKV